MRIPSFMQWTFVLFTALLLQAWGCGHNDATNNNETNGATPAATVDAELEALNQRIKDDPSNFQNYLDRAKYYGARQQYDLALADVSRALATDSTKGAIYDYRGQLKFLRQDIRGAYDDYSLCLTVEAQNTDCLLHKAEIDIILKNYDIAMKHINDALRVDERIAKGYYLKGRLYAASGDTSLSVSSYQTAIEVDPNYYDAYIEVGLLYAGKQHTLAEEYYNSAIDLKPKSIEAWYNKAMFLQETGYKSPANYTRAFACYDTILKIDPKFSAANFNKGFIQLVYLRDYSKAISDFTEAIRLFPQYYQAYYNRGLAQEKLGRLKEAETDYREALAIKPDYTDAAVALSRILGQ